MKKTSIWISSKGLILLAGIMTVPSILSASWQTETNQFIADYLVPMIMVTIIISAVVGIIRNIKHFRQDDTRIEGLIGMAWTMGAVVIIVAAILGIVALVANLGGTAIQV